MVPKVPKHKKNKRIPTQINLDPDDPVDRVILEAIGNDKRAPALKRMIYSFCLLDKFRAAGLAGISPSGLEPAPSPVAPISHSQPAPVSPPPPSRAVAGPIVPPPGAPAPAVSTPIAAAHPASDAVSDDGSDLDVGPTTFI